MKLYIEVNYLLYNTILPKNDSILMEIFFGSNCFQLILCSLFSHFLVQSTFANVSFSFITPTTQIRK